MLGVLAEQRRVLARDLVLDALDGRREAAEGSLHLADLGVGGREVLLVRGAVVLDGVVERLLLLKPPVALVELALQCADLELLQLDALGHGEVHLRRGESRQG